MSQADDDDQLLDDGDDASDSPGMRQLRAALRKEKKARVEAEARATAAEGTVRTTTLKTAFAAAKVPAGFSKLYEGELDPKAIKDWWKEEAPNFGLTAEEEEPNPEVPPEVAEAARKISQAQQQAPPAKAGSPEALQAQLESMDFGEALAKGLVTQTGVVSHGPTR